MKYDIAFPHLNIYIEDIINSFDIGNFTIAFYGIIMSIAMILGFLIVLHFASKSKQNTDYYYDLFIFVIIFSIIGARAYYVIFNWAYYSTYPSQIINLRAGGLAIYGGIIFGVLTTFVFCKIRKISFIKTVDTAIIGVALGQAIGRWGNFFNMEAFGTYTNNPLAMQIRKDLVNKYAITIEMLYNQIKNGEYVYVQMHPTFLYESIACLIIFVILMIVFNHKKHNGVVFATYMVLYGIARFFIEGLRTDSLYIGRTDNRVSQIFSIVIFAIGIIILVYNLLIKRKEKI
ncbi:MAG: prolipoprotein diacylglyceryl transferase [Eubacteriales bacterium]|nr:prolipoprotein diacylglyceryl transferase [Eubacteriales bacterium]